MADIKKDIKWLRIGLQHLDVEVDQEKWEEAVFTLLHIKEDVDFWCEELQKKVKESQGRNKK